MIRITELEDLVASKLSKLDTKPLAVVLDCEYASMNQKAIYIEYTGKTGKVDAFYREQGPTSNEKVYVTTEFFGILAGKLESGSFGGISTTYSTYDISMINVDVDVQLGLIMFESALYKIGRCLMAKDSNNYSLVAGGYEFNSEDLRALKNVFKQKSYYNYLKFIYSRAQSRIVPKCYKKKAFYGIQKAFVPVFIHYDYVYDPFVDDHESKAVSNSRLYNMAVEKNRIIKVSEHLSCYMLTHEEICASLGLSKFMRFTPEFIYKVFVGLLRPDLPEFPSKQQFKYVLAAGEEQPEGFKRVYNENEFLQLRDKLANKVLTCETSGNTADVDAANFEFNKVNAYIKIDTLRYHCNLDRRTLTSIGSSVLDKKITVNDLYAIIFEATLGGD